MSLCPFHPTVHASSTLCGTALEYKLDPCSTSDRDLRTVILKIE